MIDPGSAFRYNLISLLTGDYLEIEVHLAFFFAWEFSCKHNLRQKPIVSLPPINRTERERERAHGDCKRPDQPLFPSLGTKDTTGALCSEPSTTTPSSEQASRTRPVSNLPALSHS